MNQFYKREVFKTPHFQTLSKTKKVLTKTQGNKRKRAAFCLLCSRNQTNPNLTVMISSTLREKLKPWKRLRVNWTVG